MAAYVQLTSNMFTLVFTATVLITFTAATISGPRVGAKLLGRIGAYVAQGCLG